MEVIARMKNLTNQANKRHQQRPFNALQPINKNPHEAFQQEYSQAVGDLERGTLVPSSAVNFLENVSRELIDLPDDYQIGSQAPDKIRDLIVAAVQTEGLDQWAGDLSEVGLKKSQIRKPTPRYRNNVEEEKQESS